MSGAVTSMSGILVTFSVLCFWTDASRLASPHLASLVQPTFEDKVWRTSEIGTLSDIETPSEAWPRTTDCIKVVGGEVYKNNCSRGPTDSWRPALVDSDNYIFSTSELPETGRYYPTVGNGHMGHAAYSDRLFLNGVYNGRGSRSHRAAIPAWGRVNVSGVTTSMPSSPAQHLYSLNAIEGAFMHIAESTSYRLVHKLYAHRTLDHLLVNEVDIVRLSNDCGSIKAVLDAGTKFVTDDVTFVQDEAPSGATYMKGKTTVTETRSSYLMRVYCYYDNIPESLTLPVGTNASTWTFLTSVGTSEEAVLQQYQMGVQLLLQNPDSLYAVHRGAWAATWQHGRVDVWGADAAAISRAVYGCLYYILSSLPLPRVELATGLQFLNGRLPFFGLSPESLAYGDGRLNDYQGHVFWDQETWMFPPILMLHSNLSRQIMDSRTRVLAQALENARNSNDSGARFAWEQAFTGSPTSPSKTCEKYEIHINGDIAMAIEQYVSATADIGYITIGNGLQLAEEIAQFWIGRLRYNVTSAQYHIYDVQPPDEYHYPVNDSVFTNAIARKAILLPDYLKSVLDHRRSLILHSASRDIAQKIYLPFDSFKQYHPEFDGYQLRKRSDGLFGDNPTVKQADAIMLGYPLMVNMSATVHQNDLDMYAEVTDPNGPAMTWSIFAIGYLQLHAEEAAAQAFAKQFRHIRPPFQIWTENPDGSGAVNFITGMGGFLQSVLSGYAGIRLHANYLFVDPRLPYGTTCLFITGLDYRGSSIDVNVTTTHMALTLTLLTTRMYVEVENPPAIYPLTLEEPLVIPISKAYIVPY